MIQKYRRFNWPLVAILAFVAVFTIARLCQAESYDVNGGGIERKKAIHAILGEARGEGYQGMLAVAHAIRNRATLDGVNGQYADISDATGETYQLAAKAWSESETTKDITNGANSWENVKQFGTPYWARYQQPTAVIGDHAFFKVKLRST